MTTANDQLHRLSFVPETATKGYTIATNVYVAAKGYAPGPLQQQIARIEDTVSSLGAPYVSKAQDKTTEMLKVVDSQVDKAVVGASQIYQANSAYLVAQLEKQKAAHGQYMSNFKSARDHYLKQIQDAVDFLLKQGLVGTAKSAVNELAASAAAATKIPGYALKQVHDSFERALAMEPVQKALASAKPAVDAAYQRYEAVHGAVVASPRYKQAYELAAATAARAQETFVYRRARDSLYPYVAKYADPALEQITSSTYYKAALTHVAPRA